MRSRFATLRHLVGTPVPTIALCGLLAALAAGGPAMAEDGFTGELRHAVASGNAFATDLYSRLAGEDGNLFFSPHSVHVALSMTLAGAAGETESGMRSALHAGKTGDAFHAGLATLDSTLRNRADEGLELSVANAIWGDRRTPFEQPFLSLLEEHYGAGLRQVDLADLPGACRTINGWVEDQTRGRIQDLLDPSGLTPPVKLVLTNAIYFKGLWVKTFDEAKTRDLPFRTGAGLSVDVPMMSQEGRFPYYKGEGFAALEMPYEGEDLAMLILLPDDDSGMADLEARLSPQALEEWTSSLREQKVHVVVPRFKLETRYTLNEQLVAMGMDLAFDSRAADFTRMTGKSDLYISLVAHKAFVEVSEEGTEAAAATGVVMTLKAAPRPLEQFVADHPFLFLIRDRKTGAILFLGRLTTPTP